MTKEQVREVLDRVLTWSPERQRDVVDVLTVMEQQQNSSLHLTDEQLAEVRLRKAEENPEVLTLEEFDQRLRRFNL